jgi:DNA-binding PadR family transcriptional regulator
VTHTPLKLPVFHILLAVADREIHGLGIADWIERHTDGAVDLGPGTLYRSLKEMLDEGLVRETRAPESDADPRRKYYAITAEGRRQMVAEVARLERLVQVARDRKFIPRRV